MLSQGIEQREPRFDRQLVRLMVDAKRDADRRGQRFRTPGVECGGTDCGAAAPRERGSVAAPVRVAADCKKPRRLNLSISVSMPTEQQGRNPDALSVRVVPWSESADVQARPGRAALSPESDPERRSA